MVVYRGTMPVPTGFAFSLSADGTVEITHHGRRAGRLRGVAAHRFLADVERDDPQLVMAKATGAYKHGNERTARQHPRNLGGR